MLELGTHKGRKDDKKLLSTSNKIWKKYNSLQQACRHIMDKDAQAHICKIRSARKKKNTIENSHLVIYKISFPLPDKKYAEERFMRTSIAKVDTCIIYRQVLLIKSPLQLTTSINPKQPSYKGTSLSDKVAVRSVKTLKIPMMRPVNIYDRFLIIFLIA